MKSPLTTITASLLFLFIYSCEKQTNWDLQSSARFPVADCILTNRSEFQELKLYQSSEQLNIIPVGISGARIEVTDGITTVEFQEDALMKGHYISSVPFRVSAGNIYRLTIVVGEYTDTAFAEMNGVTPFEAIDVIPSDSLLRFRYHNSPKASMMEVQYDWSEDTAYCHRYGACEASEVYYTLDNIDVEKEFAPDRQIIHFPNKTTIVRTKYSLSTDHQHFIRALLLETEWRGGLFDSEQGNVPTNFRHGIRGWFAACMVISDTTYLQ